MSYLSFLGCQLSKFRAYIPFYYGLFLFFWHIMMVILAPAGNKRARSVPQRMKKKDEKEKEKEGISIDLLRVLGAFYVALLL